jgi:hypothetical protein
MAIVNQLAAGPIFLDPIVVQEAMVALLSKQPLNFKA